MGRDNLEGMLNSKEPTLKEELTQAVKDYPKTFIKYLKQLTPAILVSSVGAAAGQWAANELGYDSNVALTTAGYIAGTIPGYSYFFGSEFLSNRQNYPNGILSKEFGEFAGSFMASDYLADLTTFTPAFVAGNVLLNENTDMSPFMNGVVAWNAASFLYLCTMSALHPVAERVTRSVNNKVRGLWKNIRKID